MPTRREAAAAAASSDFEPDVEPVASVAGFDQNDLKNQSLAGKNRREVHEVFKDVYQLAALWTHAAAFHRPAALG